MTENAELDAALEEFVGFDGPAFLEVSIDPDAMVFPMVGPGAAYADMNVGPFIKGRGGKGPELSGNVRTDAF